MTQFTSRAYHHWQGLCAHALLGEVLGLVFGLHHRLVAKQQRALGFLETELGRCAASSATT